MLMEKVVLFLQTHKRAMVMALSVQALQHKRSFGCKILGVLHGFADPQVSSLLQKFLALLASSHNLTALIQCSPRVCSRDLKVLQD